MHVLVVGGTGMLAGVSQHFAEKGSLVSVLARRPERLGPLPGVNPVPADYTDAAGLEAALCAMVSRHGPVDLVVATVDQSAAPRALDLLAQVLSTQGRPFRLFHVRGSRAADPVNPAPAGLTAIPDGCLYRQVVLGWVDGRWLNHAEISRGVIQAVEADREEYIVGSVRPWHLRPSY